MWSFKQGKNAVLEAIRLRVESAFLQHDVLHALQDLGVVPKETSSPRGIRTFQRVFSNRSLAISLATSLAVNIWTLTKWGTFVPPESLGFSQSQIPLLGVSRQAIQNSQIAAKQTTNRLKVWASLDQLSQSVFRASVLGMVAIGSYVAASWTPLVLNEFVAPLLQSSTQIVISQKSPSQASALQADPREGQSSIGQKNSIDSILANYRRYLELTTLVQEKNTNVFTRRHYTENEINKLVEDMRMKLEAQHSSQ